MKKTTIPIFIVSLLATSFSANAALVGYWDFNGSNAATGAGNIKDLATADGSHDGTLINGAIDTSDFASAGTGTGGSLNFSSTSGYVEIDTFTGAAANADFDTGNAITVSAWVKGWPALNTSWQTFVSKNGEGSEGWQLRKSQKTNDSVFTVRGLTTGGGDVNKAPVATAGSNPDWTHLAATYESGVGQKFYVNGVLIDTDAGVGSIGAATLDNVVFGGRSTGGTAGQALSNIQLDEISIWSNALDQSAITQLAAGTSALSVPEPSTSLLSAFAGTLLLLRRRRA